MLAIVFVVWFVFAITCGVLVEKFEHEIFGFLFFLSLPIIFYLPLFLK